jgi:hypothetical protein
MKHWKIYCMFVSTTLFAVDEVTKMTCATFLVLFIIIHTGSIPGATTFSEKEKRNGFGTGSTQPRE